MSLKCGTLIQSFLLKILMFVIHKLVKSADEVAWLPTGNCITHRKPEFHSVEIGHWVGILASFFPSQLLIHKHNHSYTP